MKMICILGRSGCGKSTIESALTTHGYNRIISYTTRKPRDNEVDGMEYHFVSIEKFNRLVEKDMLMEHAEYNGNMYGSPRPIGSINNVIVVESDGFKTIKGIYGKQVIGVYINVDTDMADNRASMRGSSLLDRKSRTDVDNAKFSNIASIVDIVIDGGQPVESIVSEILQVAENR